ncbi:RING-type domain-containing protein [Meloidogyne graminicola]|uniref:RING-type E3 ubiquitin transferase n=1 Tax=Meloidogyne graminicola TaxID=189291 RepID=A0A8S9ZW02_9BILA|nr:RING-type domain-containing protein [Meloidogyne graminicola]
MNNGLGPSPTETVTGGKTLELSKYDKVRRPHKLITDETKIKVTSRTLSAELCCPICLDLLTFTMTTKECLHRFCSECITTALMRGNKECPTCRKKIISKRSLRPDPNFDFLINQIWPDRKQYDVECVRMLFKNVSMQLFQKQSNVVSLQRSIQEGIRAQAACRKQRIQGSYDYEKRRRRPKAAILDSNNGLQQNSEELSTSSIEHITVSLTPAAYLDMDTRCSESPIEFSFDESGSTSEGLKKITVKNTNEDSSSTSDSSTTTSSIYTNKGLSQNQKPLSSIDDAHHFGELVENNLEHLAEEMRRRGDELEVELAPSKALLNRGTISTLSTSHYIRTSSEITVAVNSYFFNFAQALNEFLLCLANQTMQNQSHDCATKDFSSNNLFLLSDIKQFFVDRRGRLCSVDTSENLATIFCNSIEWNMHLIIFFDFNSSHEFNLELDTVVGDEFIRYIERFAKTASLDLTAEDGSELREDSNKHQN